MNRKEYKYNSGKFHQARYAKVLEQMDLLGIMDISTTRQSKNGTIQWKLPVKNYSKLIEVASFKSGYVRVQNCGYTAYQLNKCKPTTEYYKDYRYTERGNQEWTGKYNKFVGKTRILIPIEIDRLEYLISYCLKNYYIKNANQVANGDYVTKWRHEWELEQKEKECRRLIGEASQYDCGHYERIRNLEVKLDTIQRISEYGETE